MPTTVTHTVKTGGGGDYTSLNAWDAGEARNLPFLDEEEVVECSGGTDSGGEANLSTWGADSTRHITIKAAAGEEAGSAWDSGIYIGPRLSIYAGYTVVQDLQINSGADTGIYLGSGSYDTILRRCFIRNNSGSHTLWFRESGNRAENCIVRNDGNARCLDTRTTAELDNCTFYGATAGAIYAYGGSLAMNNCAESNTGGYDFFGGVTVSGDYNLSEDASAPGANSQLNATIAFVDAANNDFSLDNTGVNDAVDNGTSLSGTFSDDINGTSRPQGSAWDIGAHEWSAPIFEESLTMAASAGMTVSYELIVDASVSMAADAGMTVSTQADQGVALTMDAAAGMDAVGSAVVSAALSMDAEAGMELVAGILVAEALTMAAEAGLSIEAALAMYRLLFVNMEDDRALAGDAPKDRILFVHLEDDRSL